ncbi:MAG: glycosyltransferase [Opitutales bacterium]|nr:glycosyltransferase [Opitutales bacterium]
MKVFITSQGSTGDIFPLIAVARALGEKGSTVTFATFPVFREEIEKAGAKFISLPPHWQQQDLSRIMAGMYDHRGPARQLQYLYRTMAPYLEESLAAVQPSVREADVVLSSYLFPLGKFLPEEMKGKPEAVMAFAPNTVPLVDRAPYGTLSLPRWFPGILQKWWAAFLWKMADWVMARLLASALKDSLFSGRTVRNFFSAPAQRVLIGVSPLLRQGSEQDPERYRFVGYCRWQNAHEDCLDEEIRKFTNGQEVPVITFGSMVDAEPEKTMARFLRHWPLGKKVILQAGWSGFTLATPQPHVKLVGPVSHDDLFAHASVVVHHGGAGTTASVLYAGKPQIIVPHIADQPFFAGEIERLGVGLGLSRKKWPEDLPKALTMMEKDPLYKTAATKIAIQLRNENGPQAVVKELESMVGK